MTRDKSPMDCFDKKLLGSAPIGYEYSKFIFTDPNLEEEWKNTPQSVKDFAMRHLKETALKMSNKVAIEMLCLVINDLIKRIEKLEEN